VDLYGDYKVATYTAVCIKLLAYSLLSFCSTYNTKNIKEYEPSPVGHTPKPDGAIERFRLPEVLYDNWCGALHRGVRGLGRGLCTNPRP
jgi:hypothetical protein